MLKKLYCVVVWLLLLVPALQARLKWAAEPALNGAFTVAPHAQLSWASLRRNEFQPALEHYLEDRIGFRSLLIRLRNQLAYSVFGESWASNIVVGRHGILFGKEYVAAYLGQDYVGDAQVRLHARRLRNVQDSLARHGVQLVFVIAPSKATFMPENLPRYARQQPRTRTNYEAYRQALPAAGIHVVDFSQALRRWKRTARHPLFASGGVHWSMYGGALAADSLQRFLRDSLHVPLAPFRLGPLQLSSTPRNTDNDLTNLMNLTATPFQEERLAYAPLEFQPAAGQRKPNLLLIADSFGWTWIADSFTQAFSDQSRYWYYNEVVAWPDLTPEGRDLAQLKKRDQYLARNVIVLLFNEHNLVAFDKDFDRDLFNIFHPYLPADHARYGELRKELLEKATWDESVDKNFDRHVNSAINTIIDKERLARELGK